MILIAVLGVAAVVMFVDRVIIGSDVTAPAESSAGVVDSFALNDQPLIPVAASPLGDVSGHGVSPSVTLAQRLRGLGVQGSTDDPSRIKDAFSPGPGWAPLDSDKVGPTDNIDRLKAAQNFQKQHVLDAVMINGNQHYAVVGGRVIHVGESLDGYHLEQVHARAVVFQARGIRVELSLKSAAASP